jgi:hydrogenase maturation protease
VKPILILGLGNPLMGDDGVGHKVAELLASRLPDDCEVICAGTDVLRWADEMEGRSRVILIDALLGDTPGDIAVEEYDFPGVATRQWNVHHLSAPQSIALLRIAVPSLRDVRFTLVGIGVESVQAGFGLSPRLAARLPEILDRVRALVG